jgi:hypothetical protein
VFINMAFMREMQVSVVQVIDVAVVLYGDMSAVGTMLVSVLLVDGVRLCRQKCISFGFRSVFGTWVALGMGIRHRCQRVDVSSVRPSHSLEVVFL